MFSLRGKSRSLGFFGDPVIRTTSQKRILAPAHGLAKTTSGKNGMGGVRSMLLGGAMVCMGDVGKALHFLRNAVARNYIRETSTACISQHRLQHCTCTGMCASIPVHVLQTLQ